MLYLWLKNSECVVYTAPSYTSPRISVVCEIYTAASRQNLDLKKVKYLFLKCRIAPLQLPSMQLIVKCLQKCTYLYPKKLNKGVA